MSAYTNAGAVKAAFGADQVIPGLWQGPRPHGDLRRHFDMVVLAAFEYQPDDHQLLCSKIVRAPIDDGELSPREAELVMKASEEVANAIRRGRRVLVTCHAGLNRSGLVSALALLRLKMRGEDAIAAIRRARAGAGRALCNYSFERFVQKCAKAAQL